MYHNGIHWTGMMDKVKPLAMGGSFCTMHDPVLRQAAQAATVAPAGAASSRRASQPMKAGKECPVCMDVFTDGWKAMIPCGHLICSDCLTSIITVAGAACPMCRTRLTAYMPVYL
jgi:hypothetical protein